MIRPIGVKSNTSVKLLEYNNNNKYIQVIYLQNGFYFYTRPYTEYIEYAPIYRN